MLKNKNIALGITGGIAAYKAAELASLLMKAGCQVQVVMTRHGRDFICPLTFETLTHRRVYIDDSSDRFEIEHVSLAKWADAFVVAPATANCMAKLAGGIADDLLSTSLIAFPQEKPVLIAPAMNTQMWKHPATQANLELLKARGVHFVGPERGFLACGDEDIGRMSQPAQIFEAIDAMMDEHESLKGINIMVTAGPTVEKIDPVRFITNRSTGKMGYAIARAAAVRGANVKLVSGPVALKDPQGVDVVRITSCAQLFDAVTEAAPKMDIIIQAAAPADFTPAAVAEQKIKKTGEGMSLALANTRDIAKFLGENKREGQVLVAFAAESENVVENAQGKMKRKNADLIVANDVTMPGAGFGVDTNIVTLITPTDSQALPVLSKDEVAHRILDAAKAIYEGR